MNKQIKYLNFIIFAVLLLFFSLSSTQKNISTNILSILPDGDNKELLKKFENIHNTKLLFIGYKSLDKNSLEKLKQIEKKLLENQHIKKLAKNKLIEEYEKKHYYLTNTIDTKKLEKLDTHKELQTLYQQIVAAPFNFQIDTKDPLNIFQKNSAVKSLYFKIKEYGYITILQLDNSIDTMQEYQELYDFTKKIQLEDSNIELFSSLFYYVESQNKIKRDTNTIIFIAVFILVILYLLILKNLKLLLNTLVTLGSSILFALIVTVGIFGELSIFSVIFGISISTIAIDYMFHNYMHGFYENKKTLNKDVFYGMFTTVGAFFILSFCEFKLIEQLSFFAVISLFFSYLQFSFIYPYLGFIPPKNILKYPKIFFVKPSYITLLSLVFIVFSLFTFKFDLDIKNLDVQNKKLQQLDEFFTTQINGDKKIAVLIFGNTLKELIENGHTLVNKYPNSFTNLTKIPLEKDLQILEQYDFDKINQELNSIAPQVGFRAKMFQDSYKQEKTLPQYNFEQLKEFGIAQYKTQYISYVIVSKKNYNEILQEPFVKSLSVKELFQADLKNTFESLKLLAGFTILFILFMLYLSVKRNFFKALNYILFPLGIIGILAYFIEFNILHIFMMIVIVSISIDYGIYMNNTTVDTQTQKAVVYSLLSTFAGFGVLIFSSLNALFSIGIVATVGIVAIMILLLLQNNLNEEAK